MKAVARVVSSSLVFAAAALVGPIMRLVMWPPYKFETDASAPVGDFVRDFVFLIWPAGPLGVVEVNTGPSVATFLAVGANILLFSLVGLVAGVLTRQRFQLLVSYVIVCALVLMYALWGAGFSFAYLGISALMASWVFYGLPFWSVARLGR